MVETRCNSPGLSVNAMVKLAVLPAFNSPRVITRDKNIHVNIPAGNQAYHRFPTTSTLLNKAAATATAPAPSAINFCSSIKAKIALDTSSSVTVTISSTYFYRVHR